jgi:Arc/MetJ-type ribon-helix-helix transcriptional regulator
MKISVSLSEADVEFLDHYARSSKVASRSAVVQRAVKLLRASGLATAYAAAWKEWEESGDADAWGFAVPDGLGDRSK